MAKKIFSSKTETHNGVDHKVYTLCNLIRFKFKQQIDINSILKKLESQDKKIKNLEKELKLQRTLLEKSIDITTIPKATGSLRKLQLCKTEVLKAFDKIMKKHNLTYWLEFGTLIGAIRHKGFIPWDDDVDISMIKEDYLKLPEIFENEPDFEICLCSPYSASAIIKIFYKEYLCCIDVFPMEYINGHCETEEDKLKYCNKWNEVRKLMLEKYSKEDFISKKIDQISLINDDSLKTFKNKVFGTEYTENKSSNQLIRSVETMAATTKCGVYNTEYIFPLQELDFEGVKLPCPNNPIEHLYASGEYGPKGSVMNFPTIKDSGFAHTQRKYDDIEAKLDTYYIELKTINEK